MRPQTVWLVRGGFAGLLAAGIIVSLRAMGFLHGTVALLMVCLLVILVPTSRNVSRRVLFAGAIILGWLPVTFWFDLGVDVDRAGWLLAVSFAALTAWVFGGADVRARLRSLIPRVHGVDAIPLVAAITATWLYLPLLTPANASRTLSLLMKSGWDHVAHFNMVELMARSGSLFGSLGASPDGSSWDNAHYPKQFHILVDFAVQFLSSSSAGDVDPGIRGYGQGTAIVLIAMIVVLAAGLAQLPGLIKRPAWAWPIIALPIGALAFGPGSVALTTGYPNYVLACVTVGLTACVAVTMAKVFLPLQALALTGLLIATAHGWILLLPIAVAAAAIAAVPFRRVRWRAPALKIVLTLGILLFGLAGIAVAVWLLLPELRGETLLLGASEPFPAGMIIASVFLTVALAAISIKSSLQSRSSEFGIRAASAGIVPFVSFVLVCAIGLMQFRTSGTLLYYFGKLATGAMLISLIILVLVVSSFPRTTANVSSARSRLTTVSATVLLSVAALQAFGYVGPRFGGLIAEEAPGLKYRSDSVILTAGDSDEALRLIAAAQLSSTRPFGHTLYLAPLPGDPLLHLANQWHLALAGTWSDTADSFSTYLDSDSMASAVSGHDLGPEVSRILTAEPSLEIIVAPAVYDEVRPALPVGLRDRLITWH